MRERGERPCPANVLLVNPSFELGRHRSRDNYVFPFGLAYVAARAEHLGHRVEVWDIHASQADFPDVLEEAKRRDFSKYDVIGFTGIVSQYLYVKKLCEVIRPRTGALLVLGGPLASYSWEVVLKHTDVDACVIGEGEETFAELLAKGDPERVAGLAYRDPSGSLHKNADRPLMQDLDFFPAFHLFDVEFYATHGGMMDVLRPYFKGKRVMALTTTRGCPYNCKFCSKSVRGVRTKSIEFLDEEIAFYKEKLGVEAIHFVDELVFINKKRFFELCRLMQRHGLPWDCQGRINLVDERSLRAMLAAGGACIGFGIESGSQKILDAMDKRVRRPDVARVLRECVKLGLPVKIQLIFGYPGEDQDTLNDTVALFREVMLPGRRLGVITPLPGSRLYDEAKADGFLGDGPGAISEVDYLEFLSRSGGWVTPDLFYNRTAFSDREFWEALRRTEARLINGFLFTLLRHPLHMAGRARLYWLYLQNWLRYKEHLWLFRVPRVLLQVLTHPRSLGKYLRKLRAILGTFRR
ncbi:MAG: hypothetical protein Kow0069_16740 [Promethearchaeota archaeon]